jgi:CheY-like chemotaxis protein
MKVMIVDDHAGVRTMIRQLLAAPGDSFVECATGEAAVQTARDFKPDYITMDVRLPDLSGLEAARAIRVIHPASRLIIVTSYDQSFLRQTASEVGAIGYVLKDNLAELRSLLADGTLPPSQANSVRMQADEPARASAPTNPRPSGRSASEPTGPSSDPGQKRTPSRADNPLRVLMIEDSKNDCELIVRQLKRCGYSPRFKRVDNGAELRRALEQESWDIITTDNQLPTFSGAEALAMLRDIGLNIPTICITGSADPSKITTVLDAGACALISKDDLAPLCAAVTDALNRRPARSGPPGPSTSGMGAVE